MTIIWKRILLVWSGLFIYFRKMCLLEGRSIYPMYRAHASRQSCKLNGLHTHQGLLSSISQKGTLCIMLPCKQALFTCMSLTCLELFVAMLSSVHFCIFLYAGVSVCPLYPGFRDNETIRGIGILCIFHSHWPPKQILLFKILGAECNLMLLLFRKSHVIVGMSLILPYLEYYMGNQNTWELSTWENKDSVV